MEPSNGYPQIEKHLPQLKRLRDKAFEDVNLLLAFEYRGMNQDDIRIRALTKYIFITTGLLVSLVSLARNRFEPNDWELIHLPQRYEKDQETLLEKNERFLKMGFVFNLFSIMEGTIRVYARTLNTNQEREIGKVIKKTLVEKLNFDEKSDPVVALEILRTLRNTLHDNGIFQPTSKQPPQVVLKYRGNDLVFIEGQALKVSWEFLFQISGDLELLIIMLSRHPEIRGIKIPIIDPITLE